MVLYYGYNSARFPADTTQLYKIMDQSQAYFTLIYLKNFLMKFYSITEASVYFIFRWLIKMMDSMLWLDSFTKEP